MEKVVKTKTKTFGLSEKSNMSYYEYLKNGLLIISPNLEIRSYKLAPKDSYPAFYKDKDSYVKVFWKKEMIYDFVAEKTLLFQQNTNNDDRLYMRRFANQKLEMFMDAVDRGKKKKEK